MTLRPRAASNAPEDAATLLLDCHQRIRTFTAMAVRLPSASAAPRDEIAEATARVRRYFTVALPLHAADEDHSLAPRLRAAGPSREVAEALAEMTHQHGLIEATIAALDPLWAAVIADPGTLATHAGALAEHAAKLEAQWAPHLALEETVIFPALRATLAPEAMVVILDEMRVRRPASSFVNVR